MLPFDKLCIHKLSKLLVHLTICMSIVKRDKQYLCRCDGHISFLPLQPPIV